MEQLIILLLISACVLIVCEIFIPGFGLFGIGGIVAFGIGIILTLLFIPNGAMFVLFEVSILGGILYCLYYYAKKTGKLDKIILSENSAIDNKKDYSNLIGVTGRCITPLKPFGKGEIDGKIFEITSTGEYINNNSEIVVKLIKENRIYVEKKS